jgi:hypothetical protein
MVSKCANPACSKPFRYLHEGKLFRVEKPYDHLPDDGEPKFGDPSAARPVRSVEFFWLCEKCAAVMTLNFRQETGIRMVPRTRSLRIAS